MSGVCTQGGRGEGRRGGRGLGGYGGGGWGDNPPYHTPTFVLTHYEHEPLVMEGGTTFYFVTGGIEEALKLAKQAAGDKDVKIGGGVSTVREYLRAWLVDSLEVALSPVVLRRGE